MHNEMTKVLVAAKVDIKAKKSYKAIEGNKNDQKPKI